MAAQTPRGRVPTAEVPLLRRPTEAGAYSAAPIILVAAPSIEVVVGDRLTALRAAEAAFRSDRTVWGHRFGLAAYGAGRMVGIATAFPGRRYASLALGTGVILARAAGARHAAALARRGRLLQRLIAPVRPDTLFVSAIAVLPEFRGRGFGAALMERLIAGAKERGLGVAVDAAISDEDSVGFLESFGFKEIDRRATSAQDREIVPTEGMVRLERYT